MRAGFRIYRHSLASVPEESALDVIGYLPQVPIALANHPIAILA